PRSPDWRAASRTWPVRGPTGRRESLRGGSRRTCRYVRRRPRRSPTHGARWRRLCPVDRAPRASASRRPLPSSSARYPRHHLPIRSFDVTQITPEPILVELLACSLVPESAGVRADLVAEQDLSLVPTEFELRINQQNAAPVEKATQHLVHLQDHLPDGGHFGW